MSPQVIVNPEEVKRFSGQLKQFNSQLQEESRRINGQFQQLGHTWRDQEYQKFAREFNQTMRVIAQFGPKADDYVRFLQKKAQRADDFLRQR